MGFFSLFIPYWWIVIPGLLLSFWAQWKVNSAYKKYSKVVASRGHTGRDVANYILQAYGLSVPVEAIGGNLTDHYDPTRKVLRLSEGVYYGQSVAALGIAAHEVGHAIQHKQSYFPLIIRNGIFPIASIGSNIGPFLVAIGFIFGSLKWLTGIGIVVFTVAVLFYIITLPVEFDASNRAITILDESGLLVGEELRGAKKVLSAAALTYLAAALAAVLTLLRLLLLARSE